MASTPRPWLASYSPGMPSSIEYPRAPLYHFLQESAAQFPDRAAIIYQDPANGKESVTLTYRQLDDESSRVASGLMSLCVNKGDRVA